ncbi:hypothetical protein ABFP60_10795 [Clostridioides difficile]
MLIPISEREFKEKVKIKFNNISDGFDRYNNKTLEACNNEFFESNMLEFLKEAVDLNGIDNSYVDFYYNTLSEDDKNKLKEMLDYEDKEFIRIFEKRNKECGIYFKLSKEAIPFINRINSREILFSTIYFTKASFTIWGNYNKKFPTFYLDNTVFDKYETIAKKYNLVLI